MMASPNRVWVVEDNPAYRHAIARLIDLTDDLVCDAVFDSIEPLLEQLEVIAPHNVPSVVLLDISLPGMDGLSGIAPIHRAHAGLPILLLTSAEDEANIISAFRKGASGYVLKADAADQLINAVREAIAGGTPMTPHVANVAINVMRRIAPVKKSETYRLTDREKDILDKMVGGLTKKEIAAEVDLSVHTVNTHMRRVYQKLDVNTNTAAVAKAIREQLV